VASGAPAASQDGLRGGILGADGRSRLSTASAFDANGEANASSIRDLMQAFSSIMEQSARKARFSASPEEKAARTATLRTAFSDRSGANFQKLGDSVATAIQETMRRHGFTRRTLAEDTAQGPVITIRVSRMDVQGQVVIDKETVVTQDIRAYWFTPPEFSVDTKISISNKDLAQVGPELMDEKFQDGLVAIWTTEDRLTRQMYLNSQGVYNTPFGFTSFTPAVLAAMKNQVDSWGLAATTLLISFDIWNDIVSNSDWQQFFSPLEKHDLALEGRLGRLMGMEIITDGYLYDNLRVLQPGEVFVLAAPSTVGKVVQRQPLEASAIDERVNGVAARGWFLEQIQAQAVVNDMAVAYGKRI
jgi:hypothetical protein